MPIQYVAGDLFTNRYRARALAHGCIGSMGAGIAVGFKARYPAMYEEYRRRCKAKPREFNPGDAFLWKAEDQTWVFNLATEEDTFLKRARYEWVETALKTMRQLADAEQIDSIAIPRRCAGYGGLSWSKVKALIEQVFGGWSGTLYVYEEFRKE
jgi:O-acetyl-ADP-ribose deacetylase (regulator of RNase III)